MSTQLKTLYRDFGEVRIQKLYLVLFAIIFALITGMQDILNMGFLIYIRFALIGFVFFVTDIKSMSKIYLFLILLTSDITLYWVNICFGVFYIFKSYRTLKFTNSIKLGLFLILFEFTHFLIYFQPGISYIHIVKQLGFSLVLMTALIFIQKCQPKEEFRSLFSFWLSGLLCATTIFYIKYIIRFGIANALSFSAGIGLNGTVDSIYTFNMHPNMISRLCGTTLSVLLVLLILNKQLKLNIPRIRYTLAIILLCFFGMLTGSMSFYVMLVCMVILLVFAILKDFGTMRMLKTFVLILIALVVMLFVVQQWFPNAVTRFARDLLQGDISTGRFDIWRQCIQVFSIAPWILLVGVGMQDYSTIMSSMFAVNTDKLHNVILEILLAWGIVGFVIIMTLLVLIVKEKIHAKFIDTLWLGFVPFAVMTVVFMTGNFFYGYYMNFSFLIITILFVAYVCQVKAATESEEIL